jgi:3-oxoacyl-[acyl-carrier-protein] synthase-1
MEKKIQPALMCRNVYIDSHNIISPLGISSEENFENMLKGATGIKPHHTKDGETFFASLFDDTRFTDDQKKYTRFELLMINSIEQALNQSSVDIKDPKTLLVISTTKGNIELLESDEEVSFNRIGLFRSAALIAEKFECSSKPVVISNACISGVSALVYAQRMLSSGMYENAVVAGADLIGNFVLSGFKSFNALSKSVCRPFSNNRDGINLGEAAATVILTIKKNKSGIEIKGGAVSNDANHISGPSRTGEELSLAIRQALNASHISPEKISFISAHGTATLFNDEMESKAFQLSGFAGTPVNSMKSYFGHTLGAAGLVESIITVLSLEKDTVLPTLGFTEPGVPVPIHVPSKPLHKKMHYALKTASGFGGCNAVAVFYKA